MKISLWRRRWQSVRGGTQTRQAARGKSWQRPLRMEALEDRTLLSAAPQMVLDINPTSLSSNPSGLVAIGSTTYFTADDGTHGAELWKSDGTAAGTVLVKDIHPGSAGSNPGSLTNVNGALFFVADDGTHGAELWKSDGTAVGTVMLKDIKPGGANSFPNNL